MTNLDKQLEELIKERNDFEAENIALKAQVNCLSNFLENTAVPVFVLAVNDYPVSHGPASNLTDLNEVISKTTKQCLNSVKASAVQGFVDTLDGNSGIKVYESRIKKDGRDYAIKLRNNNG
jgi:hypothetical protein